jgi:hypothetical protein
MEVAFLHSEIDEQMYSDASSSVVEVALPF